MLLVRSVVLKMEEAVPIVTDVNRGPSVSDRSARSSATELDSATTNASAFHASSRFVRNVWPENANDRSSPVKQTATVDGERVASPDVAAAAPMRRARVGTMALIFGGDLAMKRGPKGELGRSAHGVSQIKL